MERSYRDTDVLIVIRVLCFKPGSNCIHLYARLLNAHSRFQSGPDIEIVSAAHSSGILFLREWVWGNLPRRWNPSLPVIVRRKIPRHDADDYENFGIQN